MMFLHYFKNKENKYKKIANIVYLDTIIATKLIFKKKIINKDLDFMLTFEVVTILLFCIFHKSEFKDIKNNNSILQLIMNIFVNDLDHSLRLSGVGDMSIGKHVKAYVKKFYFRVSELKKIFELKDINKFNDYLVSHNLCKNPENQKNEIIFFF